jgi:hypothetical protein
LADGMSLDHRGRSNGGLTKNRKQAHQGASDTS